MRDDAHFLMSLNDTLTCGLGACILLFIVFVILVTIEESSPEAGQRLKPTATDAGRGNSYERGRAPVPLTVRVRGDCTFVRSLTDNDTKVERTVFSDRRENPMPPLCVALLQYPRRLPDKTIAICAKEAPTRSIDLSATWGGQIIEIEGWPTQHVKKGSACPYYTIAIVHLDNRQAFVRWSN